jgi:hypothetical protein
LCERDCHIIPRRGVIRCTDINDCQTIMNISKCSQQKNIVSISGMEVLEKMRIQAINTLLFLNESTSLLVFSILFLKL